MEQGQDHETQKQHKEQVTTQDAQKPGAHQEQQKIGNIAIEPHENMPDDEQYEIMYQPVYVSSRTAKLYAAGPLIQALPSQQQQTLKGITDSMDDAVDKTSTALEPLIRQVSDLTNKAVDYLNTVVQNVIQKRAKKHEQAKESSQETDLIDLNEVELEDDGIKNRKTANTNPDADENTSLLHEKNAKQ